MEDALLELGKYAIGLGIAAVVRLIEKRRLRKKGLLKDKSTDTSNYPGAEFADLENDLKDGRKAS